MKTLTLFIALFLILPSFLEAGPIYSQIKDFGQIVATTQEKLNLDLNEYFTGNISIFKVDYPFYIPPKFSQTNNQNKFHTADSKIILIDPPKDSFGNWDKDQNWIFLDSNNEILIFTQSGSPDSPSLSFDRGTEKPFYDGDPKDFSCGSMVRIDPDTLVISCAPKEETSHSVYYFIDLESFEIKTTINEQFPGNQMRLLEIFSLYPQKILITYPRPDEQLTSSSVISTYDVTDLEEPKFMKYISADYFKAPTFIIQRVIAHNGKTIFLAEKGGTVYRADDPLNTPTGAKNSFSIVDGNIFEMQAVFETYGGQPRSILALQSPRFIYYVDWTTPNNPIPVNKYPLTPIHGHVDQIIALEVSQDFVTTIVKTAESPCKILTYYLGPSLPGDVYYTGDCKIATSLIKTERSGNSFFFLTDSDTQLDLYVFQLSKSLLQIASNKAGKSSPGLYVNGDLVQTLDITIIEPTDYRVYLASPSQQSRFGLNVPGKSSFEITYLLNGPFLTYTANDTNYNILPATQNVTFTPAMNSQNNQVFTYISNKDASNVKWYSFYESNYSIALQTCTTTSGNYKCTAKEVEGSEGDEIKVPSMAVGTKYLFLYSQDNNTITIFSQSLVKNEAEFEGPSDWDQKNSNKLRDDDPPNCKQLLASQNANVPFLFCAGHLGVYQYTTSNLSDYDKIKLEIEAENYDNVAMVQSQNFASILFVQNEQNIYFVDVFAWKQRVSDPMIAVINVPDPKNKGYSFGVGGNSLLILIKDTQTLLEYDISHPRNPVLIKTLPYVDFFLGQILSDSQKSDNIYIFGQSAKNFAPVAIVYRPQMPGNSNYLTAIPLPNPPFNPESTSSYPLYPAVKKSGKEEILIIPVKTQFGWTVRSTVQVNFNSQTQSDPNAVDYEIEVPIQFTGNHAGKAPSSSVAQVSVNLILTDESVRATSSLVYTGIHLTPEINTISFDPRNYFNGTIKSYTAIPQDQADAEKIEFIQQIAEGEPLALGVSDVVTLTIVNETFVAQTKTSILLIEQDGTKQTLDIVSPLKNTLTCNDIIYNSYLQQTLTTCLDAKTSRYNFAFVTLSEGGPVGPVVVDTLDAGKPISKAEKTIFTSTSIFVLENVDDVGSFIHVFFFKAPQDVTYVTTITSSELNTNYLSVSDMAINYKGESGQYRLFLIDTNYGLRSLDMTIDSSSQTFQFSNPTFYALPGKINAVWDQILAVNEQGDLGASIDLVISSPNYKTYYMKFQPQIGLTVKRVFVTIPNTSITGLCYADGQTFLASAYDGSKHYALLYSISNITSFANGQNFPLYNVQYTPTATGGCSISFDKTAKPGPSFYATSKTNLLNYTVNSNVTMIINGTVNSKYITIEANSANNTDSFQFYLVRPPSDDPNYLLLYIIVGGVAVIILIGLFCYCNIKFKRKRGDASNYSSVNDESFRNETV